MADVTLVLNFWLKLVEMTLNGFKWAVFEFGATGVQSSECSIPNGAKEKKGVSAGISMRPI
jgi:hypothetical protein